MTTHDTLTLIRAFCNLVMAFGLLLIAYSLRRHR